MSIKADNPILKYAKFQVANVGFPIETDTHQNCILEIARIAEFINARRGLWRGFFEVVFGWFLRHDL